MSGATGHHTFEVIDAALRYN